jgi:hypothetical protein
MIGGEVDSEGCPLQVLLTGFYVFEDYYKKAVFLHDVHAGI